MRRVKHQHKKAKTGSVLESKTGADGNEMVNVEGSSGRGRRREGDSLPEWISIIADDAKTFARSLALRTLWVLWWNRGSFHCISCIPRLMLDLCIFFSWKRTKM